MTEGKSVAASSSPRLQFTTANLNYFDTHVKRPNDFRWTAKATQLERPSNTTTPDTHQVRIYDLRSISSLERNEMGFTLDKGGFESMQGWGDDNDNVGKAWKERKWEAQEWIETEYYSYVERHVAIHVFQVQPTDHCSRLVKHKLKATSVVAWNYTLRKPTYGSSECQDGPALVGKNLCTS